MSRKGLLNWVSHGFTKLVDPDRETRLQSATQTINRGLAKHKRDFRLSSLLEQLALSDRDLAEVRTRVYREALARVTRDNEITANEASSLTWISQALGLPADETQELNESAGREVVARVLTAAFEDGVIDDAEAAHLGRVACWLGLTTGDLINRYFLKEGESFLLGLFLSAVNDGHLSREEWAGLCESTEKLGLSREDLRTAIGRHAGYFIERIFAEAKSDGRLSSGEEEYIRWLINVLDVSRQTAEYFEAQIQELRIFTMIADGRLPSVSPLADLEVRSGEITHFYCRATFIQIRELKSGRKIDRFQGIMAVTDGRFVFVSPQKTHSISHRQIVACVPYQEGVELRTGGKGSGLYDFGDRASLATAILKTAVGRFNQTIVEKLDGTRTRAIPREVRQRVWQKYGGQCAECADTRYLEFDHIIPHSRGGSNSENNIQLLCRGCNLKKLDHI